MNLQPNDSVPFSLTCVNQEAPQEKAVYCIIKVQEETSSFVSYVPKTGDDKERKIARGRRRINHYYFFIKDPEMGTGNSIRIASYAPFAVTVCMNGHNFVAQYLSRRGVGYQMRDNLFVAVDDKRVFRRAIAAFTPRAIERIASSLSAADVDGDGDQDVLVTFHNDTLVVSNGARVVRDGDDTLVWFENRWSRNIWTAAGNHRGQAIHIVRRRGRL